MSDPVLALEDFSLDLGGRAILRSLTFSVRKSERIAIVGPNGAGKTTLLKCLNRIHFRGRGSIRVAGRPLKEYSQDELARRLAYVPQAEGLSVPFTVEEFVLMGRYPHLGPLTSVGQKDREAVRGALEATGTTSFAERSLDTLSGGERQKVFLAAALTQEADILLLDEPAAFLDPAHQVDIYRLLRRIHRERGTTILSVTHDLNTALTHSDRVLALREAVVPCAPQRATVRCRSGTAGAAGDRISSHLALERFQAK